MTTPTMIPTITMVERKPVVAGVVDWDGVGVTEEVEDGEGKSIERKKLTIFVISSYMYQ